MSKEVLEFEGDFDDDEEYEDQDQDHHHHHHHAQGSAVFPTSQQQFEVQGGPAGNRFWNASGNQYDVSKNQESVEERLPTASRVFEGIRSPYTQTLLAKNQQYGSTQFVDRLKQLQHLNPSGNNYSNSSSDSSSSSSLNHSASLSTKKYEFTSKFDEYTSRRQASQQLSQAGGQGGLFEPIPQQQQNSAGNTGDTSMASIAEFQKVLQSLKLGQSQRFESSFSTTAQGVSSDGSKSFEKREWTNHSESSVMNSNNNFQSEKRLNFDSMRDFSNIPAKDEREKYQSFGQNSLGNPRMNNQSYSSNLPLPLREFNERIEGIPSQLGSRNIGGDNHSFFNKPSSALLSLAEKSDQKEEYQFFSRQQPSNHGATSYINRPGIEAGITRGVSSGVSGVAGTNAGNNGFPALNENARNQQTSSAIGSNLINYSQNLLPDYSMFLLAEEDTNISKYREKVEKEKERMEKDFDVFKNELINLMEDLKIEMGQAIDCHFKEFISEYQKFKSEIISFKSVKNEIHLPKKQPLMKAGANSNAQLIKEIEELQYNNQMSMAYQFIAEMQKKHLNNVLDISQTLLSQISCSSGLYNSEGTSKQLAELKNAFAQNLTQRFDPMSSYIRPVISTMEKQNMEHIMQRATSMQRMPNEANQFEINRNEQLLLGLGMMDVLHHQQMQQGESAVGDGQQDNIEQLVSQPVGGAGISSNLSFIDPNVMFAQSDISEIEQPFKLNRAFSIAEELSAALRENEYSAPFPISNLSEEQK